MPLAVGGQGGSGVGGAFTEFQKDYRIDDPGFPWATLRPYRIYSTWIKPIGKAPPTPAAPPVPLPPVGIF